MGNEGEPWTARYGSRTPAVFLMEKKLYFASAIDGNPNYHFNTRQLNEDTWYNIVIEQMKKDDQYIYSVQIDGEEIKRKENRSPASFNNVKVYAGAPFEYPAANAKMRNLTIYPAAPPTCEIYPRCYIPRGNNVARGPKSTANECNEWCGQQPECQGWVYSSNYKYCWIKSVSDVTCGYSGWFSATKGCSSTDLENHKKNNPDLYRRAKGKPGRRNRFRGKTPTD